MAAPGSGPIRDREALWRLLEHDIPGCRNDRAHGLGGLIEGYETVGSRDRYLGLKLRQVLKFHKIGLSNPQCAAILCDRLDHLQGAIHHDFQSRRQALPAEKTLFGRALRAAALAQRNHADRKIRTAELAPVADLPSEDLLEP